MAILIFQKLLQIIYSQILQISKISKSLIIFKKKLSNKKNINNLIFIKKNELKKKYGIKIDYLELRNIKNLKLTNTIKNAKIFVAYFINKVRLIDNF